MKIKKLGKKLESIFAPKLISGTIDELKRPASILSDNTKELKKILTDKINEVKNTEAIIDEPILDGKTRFHNIMKENRVTPKMYNEKLNNTYITHWVYLVGYVAAFLWLFYLFFSAKEYMLSSFFFVVVTVFYLQYSKQASEIREQEFLSLKEFLSYPPFWLPSKNRTNDYFEVDFDELDQESEIESEEMTEDELKDYELFKELKNNDSEDWLMFKEFMQQKNPMLNELQIYKKYKQNNQ